MPDKDKGQPPKNESKTQDNEPKDAKDGDASQDPKAGDGNGQDQKQTEDLFDIDWGLDDLDGDDDPEDDPKQSRQRNSADDTSNDTPENNGEYDDPDVLIQKIKELESQNKTLLRRDYIRAEAKKVSKKYNSNGEVFPKFDESEVTSFLEKGKLDKISPLELGYLMMNMKTILNNAAKTGAAKKQKEYDLKPLKAEDRQKEKKKSMFENVKKQFDQYYKTS